MKTCNISLIIILSILFFGCSDQEQIKPNIVLIMTDDLNDYNEVLQGHPQVITPNIKKLSDSGVSFKSIYKQPYMWSIKIKFFKRGLPT